MWHISVTWMPMLTYKWRPGSKEGPASHSIGQISSLMRLKVTSSDTTCIILWHTQLDQRRQDLCGSLCILQAETIVCFCRVYGCVMQTTANDTHENIPTCMLTFTTDFLPSPSLNLGFALLFSRIQYILAKPLDPCASWIQIVGQIVEDRRRWSGSPREGKDAENSVWL